MSIGNVGIMTKTHNEEEDFNVKQYAVEVAYTNSHGRRTELHDGFETKEAAELFANHFRSQGYQVKVFEV